jgi:hypothetical protein
VEEQNSQAYARGTLDMRKEIEIMGKITLYQSYEVSEIVNFLNFELVFVPNS